ncbi:hypothetical protein [Flavobacterium rhizosphaerae]|uniref:2TM domain-containing protein n=1 Tax=Flavobacterium rhizosphaerae TaxID=3163298 RepID=A0ABW8YZW5_9FLAO
MKRKLINLATAFVIYFAIAWLIELTFGWGSSNPWFLICFWSVAMALAEVFLFQPMRNRAKLKREEKEKNK